MAAKGAGTASARTTASPLPGAPRVGRRWFVPTSRSLVVGWTVAALAGGAYAVARQTAVFAVREIAVTGAPPGLAAQVRRALTGYRGVSLVALDGDSVLDRVRALPLVRAATYDRAFPHTLRIRVTPERPIAVVRAGPRSWLVATDARVLARLPRRPSARLPRIWLPATTEIGVGETLDPNAGGAAARALAPLARGAFPAQITSVTLVRGELTFEIAGGLELRLGSAGDLRLKLAIARRILPTLPAETTYLDVSVPERPVSGDNTQVSTSP